MSPKIDWDFIDDLLDDIEFYSDRYDRHEVYAEYVDANNTQQFFPVNSTDFDAALRVWYRYGSGTRHIPSLKPVTQYILDEALYHKAFPKVNPHCRVAGNLYKGIEYFFADDKRSVACVNNGTWNISNVSTHKFLTTASHDAQILPIPSNKSIFDLLKPCFNVDGDDLTLLIIWLIQCFSGGSHYGAWISAERGSGKSTLTRVINLLLDPSQADTTLLQTRLEDFQNFLANHYLACFDNVRSIPTEYSDTLAAAITGSTVAKRRLYSDRDVVYLHLHNVVVINGIDIFPRESDLAERFLYFHLTKIPGEQLKPDNDIEMYVETHRSEILGCIFNILAEATQKIHTVMPKNPTRMANAYTEMLAIAKVLGISEAEFHRIITANIKALHHACAQTPLVEAICEYMNGPASGQRKVHCSSTNFFHRVKAHYSGPLNLLPKRAADFSKQLKKEHDGLLAMGFQSIVDNTGADGSTITIIRNKK